MFAEYIISDFRRVSNVKQSPCFTFNQLPLRYAVSGVKHTSSSKLAFPLSISSSATIMFITFASEAVGCFSLSPWAFSTFPSLVAINLCIGPLYFEIPSISLSSASITFFSFSVLSFFFFFL